MPESAGPLQHVVLSRTPWPILGAIVQAALQRRAARGKLRDPGVVRGSAMASLALAATATAAHVAVLVRLPSGQRGLFEPLTEGSRVGQIDGSFALYLDPPAAAAAGLSCAVALAAVLWAPRRFARDGGVAWVWIHVSLAGALLSYLADGFVTTALGWSVSAAAGAVLAGWTDARPGAVAAMRGALAISALVAGTAV